jgi:hypothetical protein
MRNENQHISLRQHGYAHSIGARASRGVGMSKQTYIDVTVSNPKGATPKPALIWRPLETHKMRWNHRRTNLNDAPSLIGRQFVTSPQGDQPNFSSGDDQ